MNTIINLISGGLIGSLTSLVQTWIKAKEKVSDQEFELKKIKAQSDADIAEINARIKIEETITEREIQVKELDADVQESVGRNGLIEATTGDRISEKVLLKMMSDTTFVGKYIMRPLIYTHLLVMDFMRGIIRPGTTATSLAFTAFVFIQAWALYCTMETVTPDQLMKMVIAPVIDLLVFIVSTVVSFWFADKSGARNFNKKH